MLMEIADKQGGSAGAMIPQRPTAQEVRKMCGLWENALKTLYRYANQLAKDEPADAHRLLAMQEHDMAEAAYKSTMLSLK